MTPIYAIGDIHGQFEMLVEALERIEADGGPEARVVVLGDLVDRGPDSFRIIELLRQGVDWGRDWTVLRGNHDQMFLDFLLEGRVQSPHVKSKRSWLDPMLGGAATLASYGVDTDELDPSALLDTARVQVPEAHVDFLSDLPFVYETDGLLFVHAGLRPEVALEEQDPEDLIWIREPFLSHPEPFEWLVVHGHTAIEAATHYGNRVNLDSGAGHGRGLTVGVFDTDGVFTLGPAGRAEL